MTIASALYPFAALDLAAIDCPGRRRAR